MRITNSMMVNNTLSNISVNKQQLSTLDTQLATQKKINRPSEDPIIAIRALRLRSSLNQVTQYLEKNIPDADSWLDVTSGALYEANSILGDLNRYCVQGSTDSFATTERNTIAESLRSLKEAFYSQGDVDYAGRYVFTGYNTDKTLTYQSNKDAADESYTITQAMDKSFLDTKLVYENIINVTDVDTMTLAQLEAQTTPASTEVYRIRVAYSEVNDNGFSFSYTSGGTPTTYSIDSTGTLSPATGFAVTTDTNAVPGDDEVLFNSTTGEILLGKNVYDKVRAAEDISVTYVKDNFQKGDINPTHYFDCVDNVSGVVYTKAAEDIEYNINFSQKLKINTEASDAFDIYLGRDIDDLANAVQYVLDIEAKQAEVKKMLSQDAYSDEDSQEKLTIMQENLKKEHDLATDAMKEAYESGITKMQKYQQQVLDADSNVGTRQTRLSLTKSRLKEQQTNFTNLKSKNEDIDLEDVVVNYSAAELVYNASLTAASKVVRQSLLDFL